MKILSVRWPTHLADPLNLTPKGSHCGPEGRSNFSPLSLWIFHHWVSFSTHCLGEGNLSGLHGTRPTPLLLGASLVVAWLGLSGHDYWVLARVGLRFRPEESSFGSSLGQPKSNLTRPIAIPDCCVFPLKLQGGEMRIHRNKQAIGQAKENRPYISDTRNKEEAVTPKRTTREQNRRDVELLLPLTWLGMWCERSPWFWRVSTSNKQSPWMKSLPAHLPRC